jgi:hypothetical protein
MPEGGFSKMNVEIVRVRGNRLLIRVKFTKAGNFHPEDLSWVPTNDELQLIKDAIQAITKFNDGKRKDE